MGVGARFGAERGGGMGAVRWSVTPVARKALIAKGRPPSAVVSVSDRVSKAVRMALRNGSASITMAVGVVEDANGARSVLISTSEPRGYLRPGVRDAVRTTDIVVSGTSHAELDFIEYAKANKT